MSLKTDCLFCKILKKEIPAEKIYEDENTFAFKDIHPQAKHHYLIIPKFHTDSLANLEDDQLLVMEHMYRAALHIAEQNGFRHKGFRTVINTGAEGGQTVFHLHLHLLAGGKMSARFG